MRWREGRATLQTARHDELGKAVLGVCGLEALGLRPGLCLDVLAAFLLNLAPLGDVVVVGAPAGAAGSLVDGDLKARVEDDLARPSSVPGKDLGRDVPPQDDTQRSHCSGSGGGRRMATCRGPGEGGRKLAVARLTMLEYQPQPVGGVAGQAEQVRIGRL